MAGYVFSDVSSDALCISWSGLKNLADSISSRFHQYLSDNEISNLHYFACVFLRCVVVARALKEKTIRVPPRYVFKDAATPNGY